MYDAQHAFVHHNPASGHFNIMGNYFREGPSADLFPFYFDDESPNTGNPQYHLEDNYIDDPGDYVGVVDDPWSAVSTHPTFDDMLGDGHGVSTAFDFAAEVPGYLPISTESPVDAYDRVLAYAGAFPRDTVTLRTVQEVESRTGSWGGASTDGPDARADGWSGTNGQR